MKALRLSDGRYLAYDEYGDPDGTPVIFVSGFDGVRLITVNPPGLNDWRGGDIEELANALRLETFNVVEVT